MIDTCGFLTNPFELAYVKITFLDKKAEILLNCLKDYLKWQW